MAYLKVECSVARNRKFVKAGPAPSWLWVCGIAYCQEGLTDGFIPTESLPYLGVKNAKQLAHHLVEAGLWDEVPGGWYVHDYLEHNKSASEIDGERERRGRGGKRGGRPKNNLPGNLPHTPKVSERETFPVAVVVDDAVDAVVAEAAPPLDVAFHEFVAAYPGQGRCSNYQAQTAFVDVLSRDPNVPHVMAYQALLARLEGHKRSHQWRVKTMIPRLDRYLREGLHLQELPEHPPTTLVSDKSARTLTSGAAFVAGGAHGPR